MRRIEMTLLAVVLLIFLVGCESNEPAHDGNSVLFYYIAADAEYGSSEGVLSSEVHLFENEMPSYIEFFNVYFEQPFTESLKSPFPQGLKCLESSLDEGVLTLILSEEYQSLVGVERSIADACITKTVAQFPSVTKVCIETESDALSGVEAAVRTEKDFVLEDLGAVNTETLVMLYFSDTNGRYLVSKESRSYFADADLIPTYIIQKLIEGPEDSAQLAVMPEGTTLRGIDVSDDGICTVNFSSEFLYNRPTTELLERMTILSIVNSLTELETIKSVQFLVEGKPIGHYLHMNMDIPYARDESAIGVVRAGLNETDATLYVRSWNDVAIAAIPVRVRDSEQMTMAEILLEKLLTFENINGMQNPIPTGTLLQRVNIEGGVCYVDFSRKLLDCAGDEIKERMALRAIVATLTSLDDISRVKISINGSYKGFEYFDLNKIYTPEADWFF